MKRTLRGELITLTVLVGCWLCPSCDFTGHPATTAVAPSATAIVQETPTKALIPTSTPSLTPLPEEVVLARVRKEYGGDPNATYGWLVKLSAPALSAVFPGTVFYGACLWARECHVVANRGDQLYFMPRDFNRLMRDSGNRVTEQNRALVAQAFVYSTMESAFEYRFTFDDYQDIDEPHPHRITACGRYEFQMRSWHEANGRVEEWKFSFSDEQIRCVRVEFIAVGVGDYVLVEIGRVAGGWVGTVWEYREYMGEFR